MPKLVFVVQLRKNMDRREGLRYWREVHGPISAKVPGLQKYTQNHATAAPEGPLAFDGVAELWFDSQEAFQSAVASPEWQAVLADAAKFADMDRTWAALVEEVPVV